MRNREEDAAEWMKDMKESDYTSIKEKVVSLENGLQAIGLAQVVSECLCLMDDRMPRRKKIVRTWWLGIEWLPCEILAICWMVCVLVAC